MILLSKFQIPRSYGLRVLKSQLMSDEGVCRTALATPGLLKIRLGRHTKVQDGLFERVARCTAPQAAPLRDELEDVLDVGVRHHLGRHHQLVPVLLVGQHSAGELDPEEKEKRKKGEKEQKVRKGIFCVCKNSFGARSKPA